MAHMISDRLISPYCFYQPQVLPPSLKENFLDFGVRSATDTSSIVFVVVNSNPIEVRRTTAGVLVVVQYICY